MSIRNVAAAMLLALGAIACAPTIMVTRERPAEINLRGIKQIAIAEISGSGGDEIEGLVTEQLANSNRFVVLERSHLDKVLKEQGLSMSTEFKEGDLEIGKVLPAAALVWGHVDRSEYDTSTTSKEVTCTRTIKVRDAIVNQDYSCRKNDRTGKAVVSVQFRVFDTSSARVLAARTLKDERTAHTEATDEAPAPIEGEELKQLARRSLAEAFLRVVAPYTVSEEVTLVANGDLPEVKQGNEYLKRGDHHSAVELYGKAVARANTDSAMAPKAKGTAHYALGLGLALVGDYPTAISEIRAANAVVQNDDWLDTEMRIKQWAAEAKQVDDQRKGNEGVSDSPAPATSTSK